MCCLCEWEEEETVTAQGSATVVVKTAMVKGTGFNGRKIKWDVKNYSALDYTSALGCDKFDNSWSN